MSLIEMEVTFKPLSRGRYRCNQTGAVITKSMIPAYTNALLAQGKKAAEALVIQVHHNPPSKPHEHSHEHHSKYRNKHG